MATQTQIFNFRIEIQDPIGVLEFIEKANKAALPAEPKKGAIYFAQDTEYYWQTDLDSGAVSTDYYQPDMRLSDDRIGDLIDTYGYNDALVKGLEAIILVILGELRLKRNTAGADSTEYMDLNQIYNAYKDRLEDLKDDTADIGGITTGTMVQTAAPEIAGGEV